jgi:hypothetical protein
VLGGGIASIAARIGGFTVGVPEVVVPVLVPGLGTIPGTPQIIGHIECEQVVRYAEYVRMFSTGHCVVHWSSPADRHPVVNKCPNRPSSRFNCKYFR